MAMRTSLLIAAVLLTASPAFAQAPAAAAPGTINNPFAGTPIEATRDIITVGFEEFATLPDDNGVAARPMLLVDDPGTGRLFVNSMTGPLYSLSYDGRSVVLYVNINDPRWSVNVQSSARERGFQSFAFHPDFGHPGTPGFGKFYTWTDTQNMAPPDFGPAEAAPAIVQDEVLLEWTALTPSAATYDGGPPRELWRLADPFANHNGGHATFNPLARPGSPDYGLLYVGAGDSGSGGDPFHHAQNLGRMFGKILRIDPLGRNSANGKYGIPADNPYASDNNPLTLGEIYAVGVRNPQRFAWDPVTGDMFVSDIGQNIVEEISLVTKGANLGWNNWEGSYLFVSREEVRVTAPRSDPAMTYPVVEYSHHDPLLLNNVAVTGVVVYRSNAIPQLRNRVIFGDFPSGEIFYFSADQLPNGGQDEIRRVLLRDGSQTKTFLQVIQTKNAQQRRDPVAPRTDLRFGEGPNGMVFLLNKWDSTIRRLIP